MQLPGLLIGGGIAGLTAALALRQRGLAAIVCEAAPQILPLGAGICMAPNAIQVLGRLGLAARIDAGGVPLHAIEIVDGQKRPILCTDQARIRTRFGHGTTAVRRATLQSLLLAEVGPAHVQLGKVCTALAEDAAGITATFADGSARRAAFVVLETERLVGDSDLSEYEANQLLNKHLAGEEIGYNFRTMKL